MPSFANQNTRSSSNNNSSPRRQQHSRVAKNFQRCLPNIPSNFTLAKYASQMVLAKYTFKSYTCQICQIYLQVVHLPNMHPKRHLPNISLVPASYIFKSHTRQLCPFTGKIGFRMTHLQNRHPNHAAAS